MGGESEVFSHNTWFENNSRLHLGIISLYAIPGGQVPCLVLPCCRFCSKCTYHFLFLPNIKPRAFLDLCLCKWRELTCGWKSGAEGLRNFSFRAPTGSSSFLFSTLLDQQQGRGLRTNFISNLQSNIQTPTSFYSVNI